MINLTDSITAPTLSPIGNIEWKLENSSETPSDPIGDPKKQKEIYQEKSPSSTASHSTIFIERPQRFRNVFPYQYLLLLADWPEKFESMLSKPESSTELTSSPSEIYREFEVVFETAREEIFESGMESTFSRNLLKLIDQYPVVAFEVLTSIIIQEVNSEAASEALRWIAQIENPRTQIERRRLLERSLYHPSSRVRDGAVIGLAIMDDAEAIPYLRRAIEREKIKLLRRSMEEVLEQLEEKAG